MTANLFEPFKLGHASLKHRVVMAPLTRSRADDDHTPTDLTAKMYGQRAEQSPGGLIITEATYISKRAGLYRNTPGIWNEKHIAGWKKTADAVHKHQGILFIQLWHLGRTASVEYNKEQGVEAVSPSAIPLREKNLSSQEIAQVREMTKSDIKDAIDDFVSAAKNSITAGADGIELHAAHGYLISTFLDPFANQRTDEYGGSIENRARFALEIVDAVSAAIGSEKVGIRFSPWLNIYLEEYDVNPIPQFSYLITELQRRANEGNELAYIHVVEPRVIGATDLAENQIIGDNEWIRTIWSGVIIRAGGITRDIALKFTANDDKTLVAFGRYFIANPDLFRRLKDNVPVWKYDRSTFYSLGPEGYTVFSSPREQVRI